MSLKEPSAFLMGAREQYIQTHPLKQRIISEYKLLSKYSVPAGFCIVTCVYAYKSRGTTEAVLIPWSTSTLDSSTCRRKSLLTASSLLLVVKVNGEQVIPQR